MTMASEAGGLPALRRKAQGARPPVPDQAEAGAARALRRALARAAEAECGLPVAAGSVRLTEASLAELLELPEPSSLLAVLEGPGEQLGLFALGPESLAALIEQQTTGGVLPGPTSARRPTRTDAAMSAGLIDRTMTEIEAGLAGTPDLGWAGGYRYASFLDDPRPLGLLLEDIAYRIFVVTADFAGGVRRGTVLLALPARPRGRFPAPGTPAEAEASDPAAAAAGAWSAQMQAAVLASPATLEGVLARLRLPLAAVLGWREGDFVLLPTAAVDGVTLEAAGGRPLARARLGQSHGHRALRLLPPEAGTEDDDGPAADLPGLGALPDLSTR